MITGWALYAAAVSLLVAGAAWCLEGGLARARVPTRWMWGAALFLSVAIPAGSLVSGRLEGPAPSIVSAIGLSTGDRSSLSGPEEPQVLSRLLEWPTAVSRTGGRWLSEALSRGVAVLPTNPRVERWALAFWIWGSSLTALALIVAAGRLERRRRRWPRSRILGRRVRIGPIGPAVVGVIRPEIVVPAWVASLPSDDLEMVLTHEDEHIRARDPWLLSASLLPVLAFPWNPVLWWKLKKLREAVEIDCDRRVLRGGAHATNYGRLLVRAGSRGHFAVLSGPGIAGSHPLLFRRLEAMRRRRARARVPLAVLAALGSLTLLVLAVQADTPTPPRPIETFVATQPVARGSAPGPVESSTEGPPAPSSTRPDADPPVYAAIAEESGPQGQIAAPLDEPLAVLETATDEVAPGQDGIDLVWLAVPEIEPPQAPDFFPERWSTVSVLESPKVVETPPRQPFTAYEALPDVRNRPEVERALHNEYPPHLVKAGIGGTVYINFFIDELGAVVETVVERSSGSDQLDRAALRVARKFLFTPAVNAEDPVAVWIQVPITFQAPAAPA